MTSPKSLVQKKLTQNDHKILHEYTNIAEGISQILGKYCETTVHSLEDPLKSLIYISHGEITGRKVGSPLTNLGLELIEKSKTETKNIIGPYYSTTETGKQLKSVTVLIRNDNTDLIGFLCINLDISAPLNAFMSELIGKNDTQESISENYSNSIQELVHSAFLNSQKKISQLTGISPIEKNKNIIHELEQLGIFNIKGAVENIALEIGVSKFTIYNYLRDIRARTNEPEIPVK
jgi:predicted transcriptional regulator YheO